MSTQIVQFNPQLPAFLRKESLFQDTDKAIAGIGGGMPAYVSIKASKWRLVDEAGEESLVNQLHLDVIVLAGNEHVSKSYYSAAFDPAQGGGVPPDCWSDNGVAPSMQAMTPQHSTCAGCPQNSFGSKVNAQTGAQSKACADSKKLAVVLAADTPILVNGAAGVAKALDKVYLLRLPVMSMRPWRDYAKDIRGRGVPIIGVVSRLTFDPQASYPALLFQAVGFVPNEQVFQQLMKLREAPGTAETIGANDRPLQGAAQLERQPAPATLNANNVAAAAPQPTPTAAAPAAPSAATASDTSGTRRPRGRPPGQGGTVPATQPAPLAAAPAAPLFPQNGSAIQAAQATDKSLDALLASVMGPAA